MLTQQLNRFAGSLTTDTVTPAAVEKISQYRKQIIKDGRSADFNAVDEIYPALGTMFKSTVLACVMMADGGRPEDRPKALQLCDKWVDWYNPRRLEILKALRRTAGN